MQCTSCQSPFEVTSEEKIFLDKMSPKFGDKKFEIPLPQLCPDCRLQQRTIQRNEQCLYQNKSSVTGQPIISIYAPGTPYKLYTHEEWWSDNWDAMEFGQDFDFNRPFFEQFQELNLKVPRVALMQFQNENCQFTTGTGYCKNCYLINCSENCEDCYYAKLLQDCRDTMDTSYGYDSELLYQCLYVKNCYNSAYLYYSQNSYDCYFSENLKSCKNCFLCTNLSNKEYYFLNKPLTKTEYQARVKQLLGSHEKLQESLQQLNEIRRSRTYKYSNMINCESSTGDFLTNCKNCTDCYDVNDSEDCKYVTVGVNIKDVMDCSNMYLKPELNYQVLGTIGTYNVLFSLYIFQSSNIMYSQFCNNSKNLFGCCGLRNKQYCILNKQYTKEEYEALVPRIIEHMMKTGEWGLFFPAQTAPFGYNETVAYEYFPLTREQAIAKGFQWHDQPGAASENRSEEIKIPDNISDVTDEILSKILTCESCQKNYRIIPQELKKLRQFQMPIPHNCPDCRHWERLKLRNPRKLYNRQCAKCSAPVNSTFAPEKPERIYCEKCYVEEVY